MRYITDKDGYVKEVSFGAMITCDGAGCTEYTGVIPSGYSNLEDWFIAECEQLHRWRVVNGNLVQVSDAEDPAAGYTEMDYLKMRLDGIERQLIHTATETDTLLEINI